MKKRLLAAALICLALAAVLFVPALADGEVNYAENAPGGEIFSAEDIKTAFGEGNVTVETESEETRIYFEKSVKLLSPVIIKSGTYRIYGRDCSLFRGFESGSLIMLDGSDGNAPKLVIKETSTTDWETGQAAVFTFDGNRSEFPSASGALITVWGNAELNLDGKILFKNAMNTELGGAIYAESIYDGGEGLYAPRLNLRLCKITDCHSLKGGGGIALFGGKNGEGEVLLDGVIIEKNEAVNPEGDAKGGGVYAYGGGIKISGDSQLCNNKGSLGGAAYFAGFAEIEGCSFRDNVAVCDGGAFYCDSDSSNGYLGTVAMNNSVLSYSSADRNGGAVFNKGTLLVGGSTYITDSKAKGDGGGVYNLGSFGLSAGDIITNKAEGKAGAVYNGESGILLISGGRISSNDAVMCGGIYSLGAFEFKGGSIGKNIGAVPQNLVHGVMKMGASATFTDTEVLGILLTDTNNSTVINIEEKLISRVKQSVAVFKAEADESGTKTVLTLAGKLGMQIFSSEDTALLESSVKGFKIYGRGFKSFNIKSDGTLGFKMPFMPLWAWILVLVGVAGVTVGVIFAVKILKKDGGIKKNETHEPCLEGMGEKEAKESDAEGADGENEADESDIKDTDVKKQSNN